MAELIPRKILFGNPDRGSPEVAPDGRRLAHIEPVDDILNVWVGDLAGDTARPVTSDTDRGIRSYSWAADGRHLIYLQDSGGDENWHLHIVDPESGADRDATPFDGVQARVLGISRRRPGHILVGLNKDNPELHDAYLLELETGKLERAAENPGYYDWLVDNELRPRGGMRMRDDGSGSFELDGATLLELDADDAISSQAIGFTADDSTLYVITPAAANAAGLVQITPGRSPETLADDPTYDVAAAELHPVTRTVEIVSYLRARLEHQVLDPALAPDIDAITALRPGDAFLISRDHADRTWTVGFTADDGPVAYYAFDRGERSGRFLFTQHDDLARYRLSAMEPFAFAARDGLEINGYLTFPPDAPRQNLPTVLFVHGGPWARDTWGYDPTAQWLANRGYLCVQVNYRGSTGYGKAFLNAGDREWGRRMHDRSDRRRRARGRPRRRRPLARRHLRRLLRRLRRPRRRDVHAGRLPVRRRRRRPVEPAHAPRDDPAVLEAARLAVPSPGGPPRDRRRPPVGALAALARGRHPHPAPDRPGGERPARQDERVGPDRRGAARAGDPAHLPRLRGRGARVQEARERDGVPGRGRAVPRRAPGRALRAVTPRALHIMNESSGPARVFVEALEERGFEIVTVSPHAGQLPDSPEGFAAILSGGGTADTHQTDEHPWLIHEVALLRAAIAAGVPTMGLCLGAQLLTEAAGGTVYRCEPPEVGWYEVEAGPGAASDPVMGALPPRFMAMQWHLYACELPSAATELARNAVCLQALRIGEAAWGTQFHIETTREILESWADMAPDELARFGYDRARYDAELDRYGPAHEAIGRDMAGRFAQVALRQLQSV